MKMKRERESFLRCIVFWVRAVYCLEAKAKNCVGAELNLWEVPGSLCRRAPTYTP
jgi:hypothetical protein